jgi:hypothetical protein
MLLFDEWWQSGCRIPAYTSLYGGIASTVKRPTCSITDVVKSSEQAERLRVEADNEAPRHATASSETRSAIRADKQTTISLMPA